MAIDLGDPVRLTYWHGSGGVLATAESMLLSIGQPDGVVVEVTPDAPASPGRYEHVFVPTQAGRHTVRWVGTNPAGAFADVFDVREASPRYLISLERARKRLRLDDLTDDEDLRGVVEAATAPIEDMIGPVIVREVMEVQPGGAMLVLDQPPVLEVLAVTPVLTVGADTDPADLDVDPVTGIVRRLDGWPLAGPLRITYRVGRRVVDAAILEAAEIVVEHLWATRRGHGGIAARPGLGEDDLVPTPSGYLIPNQAADLLRPFRRPPGLA